MIWKYFINKWSYYKKSDFFKISLILTCISFIYNFNILSVHAKKNIQSKYQWIENLNYDSSHKYKSSINGEFDIKYSNVKDLPENKRAFISEPSLNDLKKEAKTHYPSLNQNIFGSEGKSLASILANNSLSLENYTCKLRGDFFKYDEHEESGSTLVYYLRNEKLFNKNENILKCNSGFFIYTNSWREFCRELNPI